MVEEEEGTMDEEEEGEEEGEACVSNLSRLACPI